VRGGRLSTAPLPCGGSCSGCAVRGAVLAARGSPSRPAVEGAAQGLRLARPAAHGARAAVQDRSAVLTLGIAAQCSRPAIEGARRRVHGSLSSPLTARSARHSQLARLATARSYGAQCSVLSAQCSVLSAQCSVLAARCLRLGACGSVLAARCCRVRSPGPQAASCGSGFMAQGSRFAARPDDPFVGREPVDFRPFRAHEVDHAAPRADPLCGGDSAVFRRPAPARRIVVGPSR
jgi:hypothetical protein